MRRDLLKVLGGTAGLVAVVALGYVFPPAPAEQLPARHAPSEASDVAVRRAIAKDIVARDGIAGRTSLTRAAAVYGWLNGLTPIARDDPRLVEDMEVVYGLPRRCATPSTTS